MRVIALIGFLLLVGCGSTSKMNDTMAYQNNLSVIPFSEDDFTLRFVQEQVDVRGVIAFDKSFEGSTYGPLYDGSAGLAGMFAQVAVHSAIESGAQGGRMSKAQVAANNTIAPIITLAQALSNSNLITDSGLHQADGKVLVNPIFYVSSDYQHISMSLVAQLSKDHLANNDKQKLKRRRKRAASPYTNVIQFKSIASDELKVAAESNNPKILAKLLRPMLKTALQVLKSDMLGQYKNATIGNKTYGYNLGQKRKIIRGKELEQFCGYRLVRDLRRYLTVLPIEKNANQQQSALACFEDYSVSQWPNNQSQSQG